MSYIYGSKFDLELKERIQGYGALEQIIRWVNIYQRLDPMGRSHEFLAWLGYQPFECVRCESQFYPDPHETMEDDHIFCGKCRKSENY